MVQSLEAIKGGGGSIRVGATGTISSLMTRELDSTKAASQKQASSRNKPHAGLPLPCGTNTPTKVQPRKSSDEASSSGSSKHINRINPDMSRKAKSYSKSTHKIPMLGSDNVALDRTPNREKIDKKGCNIVEVVDIKCGNSDRAWASPITNKLKKLSFSKLSESII